MIEPIHILELTTRLAMTCFDVEVRLKKIRLNNPNRTDLITEFESELKTMIDARNMLETFKNQYYQVSIRHNEIIKEKLYLQKDNEDLKTKVKELETKIEELLKF